MHAQESCITSSEICGRVNRNRQVGIPSFPGVVLSVFKIALLTSIVVSSETGRYALGTESVFVRISSTSDIL